MSNLATTTNADPLQYSANTLIARSVDTTGYLYAMVKATTANTFDVYRSTNNGTSWAVISGLSLTRANVSEIGSIFVHDEENDWIYWTYRTNESSQDRIWFRRGDLAAGTWQSEVLVANPSNGGVAGATHQGMDIAVVRTPSWGHFIAIACGLTIGTQQGLQLYGVTISTIGVTAVNHNIISGTRQWTHTPSGALGRIGPSIDIEHVGDAKSANTPNLWVSYGRTDTWMVKCSWTGAGWSGPTSDIQIDYLDPAMDSLPARWDGNRFLMAIPGAWYADKVTVYERNRANSSTTRRDSPAHTQGAVRNASITYDYSTGNFRLYAVGTSTADLYYVNYTRGTATWGTWTIVSTDDILNNYSYSVRRSSYGNGKYDVARARTTSPQVQHDQHALTAAAPSTPTWVSPENGTAQDVAVSLVLDWNFVDIDASDTQKDYALSRQVGAGALEYWRTSDSTWQSTEQKNASTTSAVTLTATQWSLDGLAGGASDPNHTYKVKVWDSTDLASGYSTALVVIPSAKVNPVITAPTADQVIATDKVTVTWTAAEQTQFQVTLVTNPGLVVYHLSGWVTSTALTYQVPLSLSDGSGWQLWLETKNSEGLRSNVITSNFTVDYVEPPAATVVPTAIPASGIIRVVVTNPAPIGTQPALSSQDLYRRSVTTGQTVLNANPFFETDSTGWTAVNATILREAAQFHQGGFSLKVTPTGGQPNAYAELSALTTIDVTKTYQGSAWCRPTTSSKPVAVYLHWYTAADVYISSTTQTVLVPATAWQYLTVRGAPVPTAAKVKVAAGVASTPAVGDIVHVDEVTLTVADSSDGMRVAAGLAGGGTYDDWQAISGISYEYRLLTLGTNETSIYSAWTA